MQFSTELSIIHKFGVQWSFPSRFRCGQFLNPFGDPIPKARKRVGITRAPRFLLLSGARTNHLPLCVFQAAESRPHIRHHRDGSHCSRCGPGWGAISRCARGRDTVCERCPGGTYSPHHSTQPCWNCARCGPGLYEAHPCTSRTDTVCDSCHRAAPDNPDYRRKCEGRARFFLAPEDAQSTAEESVLVNEPAYRFQLYDRERVLEKDVEAVLRDKAAAGSEALQRIQPPSAGEH